MIPFVELAAATNFSFLRGASHAEEMVLAARERGLAGLAVADRNSLAGVVRAHLAAREAGLPFAVGCRLVLQAADAPDILAWPSDRAAYGRLCRLLTLGNMRGEKGDCRIDLEDVAAWGEGMVFAIVADGALPDAVATTARRLRETTDHPLRLAVSRSHGAGDRRRLARAVDLAARLGLRPLATNAPLFHVPARRPLQDVLTCIRERVPIDRAGRRLAVNAERHVKGPAEMGRLFADRPEALAETTRVMESIAFSLDELRYEYPEEPTDPGRTPQETLERLARDGAARRYPGGVPERVRAAVERELAIIGELDYAPYFLTVHDIVRFAREKGILAQGRGSAANSAVCFCLGVTEVDPDRADLLFERFVSAERREPPDIDIDFEHERREEVIQYVYEKYGRDRAGLAATVISYRSRSAAREVGKALGLSEDAVSSLSSTIWGWSSSGVSPEEARRAGLDPADPRIGHLVRLTREIAGFPRHLSQHVGGFVITRGRLDEMVPIAKAAMDGRTNVEWDKDDLDALGILKIDVLALGMLTCIRKALDLLADHYPADVAALLGTGALPPGPLPPVPAVGETAPSAVDPRTARLLEPAVPAAARGPEPDPAAAPPAIRADAPALVPLGDGAPVRGDASAPPETVAPREAVGSTASDPAGSRAAVAAATAEPPLAAEAAGAPSRGSRDRSAERAAPSAASSPAAASAASAVAPAAADGRVPGRLGLSVIPPEDGRVYDMICRADTLGVFQIESRAQMSMLPRLRPRTFYDLVIEVAIVRPGPIQGDMVHPYLRRRMGREPVTFPSRELEDVLGKTMGVPLFQEQAMRIAIVAAGFTPSEADRLRRAMATFRKVGTIGTFQEKMIEGMAAKGYDRDFAERCFRQIEGFGEYGFPESHAASFALLVYASCWLKCHYPDVFCAALLNSQPMGFYAPAQIVRDARRHGVEVRPVCVNASGWDNRLEPGPDAAARLHRDNRGMADAIRARHAVRLGFRQVKGLREEEMDRLVAARAAGYDSVRDLWLRTGLPRATIERLADADAFAGLGLSRREALWAARGLDAGGAAETLPLFAAADARELCAEPDANLPPMPPGEEVIQDYRFLSLSLKAHPARFVRPALMAERALTAETLGAVGNGRRVAVAGLILVRQRPGSAKGVIFMTLEDETGIANVVVWPKVFESFRPVVLGARFVKVTGRIQSEDGVIHVVAERLEDRTDLLAHLAEDFGGFEALDRADEVKRPTPDARTEVKPRSRLARLVRERPELAPDLDATLAERRRRGGANVEADTVDAAPRDRADAVATKPAADAPAAVDAASATEPPPPAPRSTWFSPRSAAVDGSDLAQSILARRRKGRAARAALPKGRNFH